MTTVGYGDKIPVSTLGRMLGIVWMFVSIIIIAAMIGAISSAFTVNELRTDVSSIEDLSNARLVTVGGSTSETYLMDRGFRYTAVDDLESALDAVALKRYAGIVYDAPVLKYEIAHRYVEDLVMVPNEFRTETYALSVPEGSLYIESINRALLELIESAKWVEIKGRYLTAGRNAF